MSSLTFKDKTNLEKLFDMGNGYVSSFSDFTIASFFSDTVDVDIHAEKYRSIGTSKAKKLREFWRLESDHLVGKSIAALIEHVEENSSLTEEQKKLLDPCKAIANRLLSGTVHLEHLKETVSFDAKHLAEQIRRMQESVHSCLFEVGCSCCEAERNRACQTDSLMVRRDRGSARVDTPPHPQSPHSCVGPRSPHRKTGPRRRDG
jgi:hypothetical protein